MKRTLLILSMLCAASAHAEMYKWVGPDGKTHYTDTPPPPAAKQVEKKNLGGEGSDLASLPFELTEAARNNPVTFFGTGQCTPCDDGRAFLKKRGIPFSEKTVSSNDDIKKFEKLAGPGNLPALTVGRNSQHGYAASAWGSALTAAGYPESNKLPASYQYSSAEPAAPAPAPKPAAK